jgi:lysozyme
MNKINFLLSMLWLAMLGAIGGLWAMGPKDGTAETTETLVAITDTEFAADETQPLGTNEDTIDTAQDYEPDEGLVANMFLQVNAEGLNIIKTYEGLELEAYTGTGGYYIGYGRAVEAGDPKTITAEQADAFLIEDLVEFENAIKAAVTVPMSENEYSAMASLAFNIGTSAFWSSTILTQLNNDNRQGAADAFLLWNKMSQDGQLVQSMSLTERRETERELFLSQE